MKSPLLVSVLAAVVLGGFAAAAAQEKRVDRVAGDDRFTAGGSVTVTTPVTGDLMAAGGEVRIDSRIGGDLVAAGGNVRVLGDVGESAFVAGGQVHFDARVRRSVRAGGGHVEVGPKAELGGNLSVAGGQVRIEGPVFGYVQAAGGRVVLDGPIGGDVWVTGGRVLLGPNARIGGALHYAAQAELEQDPAAIVKGGIEKLPFEAGWPRRDEVSEHRFGAGRWLWTAGLMALAAIVVGAAPAFAARTSNVLRQRPWFALLLGFIVLACVPIAAILLLVTVLGIPLALLALLAYPAALLLGYVMTPIGIGDWVMQRFATTRAAQTGWRAAAAAVVVLAIALLARVPVLGTVVVLAVLLAGLGALALQWRRPAPAG